ncbi:MAG: ice-binding family protein [Leifsonia flava]
MLAVLAVAGQASAANADTAIDGPVDLGTAAQFSVLGSSTVTNTGLSVLDEDLGVSPGTSITGFPPGITGGTIHPTDAVAALAQDDLTTAYGVAASLTPMATGLGDLTGQSLTPGVYSGGELSVTGALTLEGTAESVWVFQAASTLTIASGAIITVTGEASVCNVFWQVGSSATIEPGAQFVGTVMADVSITAQTAATITGRLLARTGAVTLDTNRLIAPTGCDTEPGTVTTSPEITSEAPPAGRAGEAYTHTITASGTPSPTYTVSSGALPTGVVLDEETGVLSGQPTEEGTYDFEITASNGTAPDTTVAYSVTIDAALPDSSTPPVAPVVGLAAPAGPSLPATGPDLGFSPLLAATLLGLGAVLLFVPILRRKPGGAHRL